MEQMQTPDGGSAAGNLRSIVGKIDFMLEKRLTTGEVAELRRLRPDQAPGAAFYRVVSACLDDHEVWGAGRERDAREVSWMLVLQSMATLRGLHQPGRKLGEALAMAGCSEARVLKLLRSHGATFWDALRATNHQLASKATPFDHSDLARLILSEGRKDEAETRRRVARDYFLQQEREERR